MYNLTIQLVTSTILYISGGIASNGTKPEYFLSIYSKYLFILYNILLYYIADTNFRKLNL